jgi:sulfoxide reductase heme-binding subunit YedZ
VEMHPRMSDRAIRFILKPVVFAASLVPVLYWSCAASMHQLNVNPFNAIVRDTGFWSLRFLCLTVALTPLRWLTGWHAFVKFRRMIGLFAFFYAAIHFAAYIAFDSLREQMSLTLRAMAADAPRPFFATGYLSLVLMVPWSRPPPPE